MKRPLDLVQRMALSVLATLAFSSVTQAQSSQGPVFKVTPVMSKVTFYVKSSVNTISRELSRRYLEGRFDRGSRHQNPGGQRR
jgi:hypothetical protein